MVTSDFSPQVCHRFVALQRQGQLGQIRCAHPEQLPAVPSQPELYMKQCQFHMSVQQTISLRRTYSTDESVVFVVSAFAMADTPSLARKQCDNLQKQTNPLSQDIADKALVVVLLLEGGKRVVDLQRVRHSPCPALAQNVVVQTKVAHKPVNA
jgi:hypothetical protein